MAGHFSTVRFVSAIMLLDIILLALVSFSGNQADVVLASFLPGQFGPGMGPLMTGNRLLGALIVLLNAMAFLATGFAVLLAASRHALSGGSGSATSEIRALRSGRGRVQIGAVLLLMAFPAVCFTYAQADAKGAPLMRDSNGAVANAALTVRDLAAFAAGEALDAVLLDIPRVYEWHLSPLRPGADHVWMRPFVLTFHILAKLIVLALLFAAWRGRKLRASALEIAALVALPPLAARRETPAPAAAEPSAANVDQEVVETPEPRVPQVAMQHGPQPPAPADAPLEAGHDNGAEFRLEPPSEFQAPSPVPGEYSEAPKVLILDEAVTDEMPEPVSPPPEARPEDPEPAPAEKRPYLVLVHSDVEATAPAEDPAIEEPPRPLLIAETETPLAGEPRQTTEHLADEVLSDAPLALHELRGPDDVVSPAADNHEAFDENKSQPYKKTALHVLPEFDA